MRLAGRRRRGVPKTGEASPHGGALAPDWVGRMLKSALAAAMCLAVLVPYLWVHAEINEASAERRSWQRALEKTIEEHQSLQFELSALQSASRIEQVAIERLGMAEPRQIIYVAPHFD